MRIVFVSHYALPHVGGIETVVDGLARGLSARGHDVVHVASTAHVGVRPFEPDGYRIVRVPAWNWPEERLEVPVPVFSPRLATVLRRELAGADVVHVHGMLYMSSAMALAVARRAGGPARVLTEHTGYVEYDSALIDGVERTAIATLGRASARLAELVIVLNDKVRGEMTRLAPGRPQELLRNGVDTERFQPASADERAALRAELGWDERPRVLFVGRLVAKKGAPLAVAAAAASETGFELVMAGPGRLEDEPPSVALLGTRTQDELVKLYRAADLFLLPSRGEGFPVTAQEAMACGLPIVLREDPSYNEPLAGAGRAARFVPAEPGAIASTVDGLLRDAAELAASREAARSYALDHFSQQRAVAEHERIYRSLLAGR